MTGDPFIESLLAGKPADIPDPVVSMVGEKTYLKWTSPKESQKPHQWVDVEILPDSSLITYWWCDYSDTGKTISRSPERLWREVRMLYK